MISSTFWIIEHNQEAKNRVICFRLKSSGEDSLKESKRRAPVKGTVLGVPLSLATIFTHFQTILALRSMACGATLKRTMDFDPLMNPASPKRRRCAPMSSAASTSSPQKYLRMEPSPFGEVSSRLTAEQILHNIKQEYKRMQKRRHLENSFQQTDGCCPLDSQPHSSILGSSSGASSPTRKEQPLFTLRQVGMICERLLKEREEKIREEYDEILTTKLAEQYDAFVKFTHDQLMRRFGEQPASYVSWVRLKAFWNTSFPFNCCKLLIWFLSNLISWGSVGLNGLVAVPYNLWTQAALGFCQWQTCFSLSTGVWRASWYQHMYGPLQASTLPVASCVFSSCF